MAAVERPGKKAHRPRLLVAEAPPTTDAFSRDAKMTVDVPRGGAHLEEIYHRKGQFRFESPSLVSPTSVARCPLRWRESMRRGWRSAVAASSEQRELTTRFGN
ncbi:hypothetical protein OPV22_020228 [Ensete ventricosum]|uniref:Uncharacterized protein n=1 Tax=Ensete ventricosum TaxID=4639 RepID=A0AAV8QDS3_ENSVE|nr:hypothetical protein OPV22_020228 [Ensete ventricosum]